MDLVLFKPQLRALNHPVHVNLRHLRYYCHFYARVRSGVISLEHARLRVRGERWSQYGSVRLRAFPYRPRLLRPATAETALAALLRERAADCATARLEDEAISDAVRQPIAFTPSKKRAACTSAVTPRAMR